MVDEFKKIIKEEIEGAKKRLKAGKFLLEKDMIEDAANRIYYSVFYAAKAMLNSLGYDAKTHSGLISEFGLRLVKEKLVGKELGATLRRAFELRESSDYRIGSVIEKDEVENLVKSIEDFLIKAERFVKEKL